MRKRGREETTTRTQREVENEGPRKSERERARDEKEETALRKKGRRRDNPKRQGRQMLGEEEVLEPELKESQWSSRSHASRMLSALF